MMIRGTKPLTSNPILDFSYLHILNVLKYIVKLGVLSQWGLRVAGVYNFHARCYGHLSYG